MKENLLLIIGGVLLAMIIGCCTFLVGTDDLEAELFMGVVVGPTVGGLVGVIAHAKGVQSGSQASAMPPPDA